MFFFPQRGRLNTDKTISRFLQRIVTSRSVISGAICVVRGHILTGLQQRIISRFQRLHARAELNLASKKKEKKTDNHPPVHQVYAPRSFMQCGTSMFSGRLEEPSGWILLLPACMGTRSRTLPLPCQRGSSPAFHIHYIWCRSAHTHTHTLNQIGG